VSGFLNFDEKIIATTIKLAHAKVSCFNFTYFYYAFISSIKMKLPDNTYHNEQQMSELHKGALAAMQRASNKTSSGLLNRHQKMDNADS
jgi:hypothetical protein